MRLTKFASLILFAGSLWAAQIPRPAPELTIPLPSGKQVKISDYHGKVLCLAFILTTCPHCQRTTQLLEGIYKDLGPKGFDVVEAALNQNPDIPNFVSQYHVPWPVGTAGVLPAIDYIQWPKDRRPLVPFLVFIDRKGVIRAQYTGVDESFFNDQLEQHMRDEIEILLNDGAPAGHKRATHKHAS
jgi:thiol-disulfide isomerase/thioredoxin